MKKVIAITILSLITQVSYSQACGIYRLKCIGTIANLDIEISNIKLPSIPFLHGQEQFNSQYGHMEAKVYKNRFELILNSHLTSHLYRDPNDYLKLYKNHVDKIPITLVLNNNREIPISLSFSKVSMIEFKDEGFGRIFVFDLGEIKISN